MATAASARDAVGDTAKDAGHAVAHAAGAAKVPLLAGGAALMGAAGGLAVGSRMGHRRGLAMRRPKIKVPSRKIAHAAKEVGSFGAQVGRLASELQSAREAANGGGGKPRSPIEVVLDGLTSRSARR